MNIISMKIVPLHVLSRQSDTNHTIFEVLVCNQFELHLDPEDHEYASFFLVLADRNFHSIDWHLILSLEGDFARVLLIYTP